MAGTFAWKLALGAFLSAFLVGCASNIGNPKTDDFGSYLKLEKGVTTKNGVHEIFGQPTDVRYLVDDGGSIWNYVYVKETMSGATFVPIVGLFAGGTNSDGRVATFYFDNRDVYRNVETDSKSKYTNMWVGMTKGVADAVQDDSYTRVRSEMLKYDLPFDWKMAKRMRGIETLTE